MTGAIVVIASIFKDNKIDGGCFLIYSTIFFGLSVFFAATLLGEIPSIAQRIGEDPTKPIHSYIPMWRLPLIVFAGAEHVMFLLGLSSFVVFLIQKIG